ncbi:MAG: hypothetical protein IKX36_10845 [Prevotella sp.]|nr:hypothetical protein [Prevotella sp.]
MRTENELNEERDQDLWRTYLEVSRSLELLSEEDAVRRTVTSAAPRFYVSDERAARVVSWLENDNERVERMLPQRREMFDEIYRRTQLLRTEHPDWCLRDLVRHVVSRPAPQFYLTPGSGYMILRRIKRRRRRERMQVLQRFRRE